MTEHHRVSRNGRTIREAAEVTGMSPRSIRRWTSEPREVYLARAAERRQKIIELRATGLTMRAIATQLGVSVGAVHKALQHAEQHPTQPASD